MSAPVKETREEREKAKMERKLQPFYDTVAVTSGKRLKALQSYVDAAPEQSVRQLYNDQPEEVFKLLSDHFYKYGKSNRAAKAKAPTVNEVNQL